MKIANEIDEKPGSADAGGNPLERVVLHRGHVVTCFRRAARRRAVHRGENVGFGGVIWVWKAEVFSKSRGVKCVA